LVYFYKVYGKMQKWVRDRTMLYVCHFCVHLAVCANECEYMLAVHELYYTVTRRLNIQDV